MKIKDGFVLEKVGESYLAIATGALAADFKSLVKLNDTGAFLWKCIEREDLTAEELARRTVESYDISFETALADTERFLGNLKNVGILDD